MGAMQYLAAAMFANFKFPDTTQSFPSFSATLPFRIVPT